MTRVTKLLLVAIATIALLGVGLVDAHAQDDVRQEDARPAPTPEPGGDAEADRPSEVVSVVQTADEAMAEDTAIVAAEHGISQAEAAKALSYQTEFSETVAKLFAGGTVAWSEVDPFAQTGLVVFTDKAPAEALNALSEVGGVEIRDGARFNVDEQVWRTGVVAAALRETGIAFNIAPGLDQIDIDLPTGYDFDAERLVVSVEAVAAVSELPGGGGPVQPAFPGLSPGIVGRDAAVFDVSDFVVKRSSKADLITEPENSHGGEEMTWWNGSAWKDCTSGFTVRHTSTYIRGVTTAGHCGSVDYIRDNQLGLWHTTSNFAGYIGGFGDFGWYHTSGYEDGLFRASGWANYRYQQANPVWYAVGSYICFFGHKSFVTNGVNRTCNHKIEAHGTWDVTGTVGSLTRVSNRRSISGDSGGGYSFGTGAIGSHWGSSATKQYYTPMDNVLWWYSLDLAQ